ncbi:DUF11 domain-containing protein [Puniceicoccales bacterium CK1056]|uniref:DUF11 domain-containing protein n=1 Tax=Oceanipulchritudo coccoides TaxID=2706888 RepID=A0A6B2M3K7_9BACT|nr:DUF11 domain-containing protein [Oceanipulchritudo coccoides]NDV62395.1 DUF11 domain-containing protein [Oceanipulchritudo coccoides]
MKSKLLKLLAAASLASAVVLTGCATQQSSKSTKPAEPAPAKKTVAKSGYGPAYTTFDRNGVNYTKGAVAYPTGILSSSSLLLEKVVPSEVMVGAPYQVSYTLRNLSDVTLKDVVLTDVVGSNFRLSDAAPAADAVDGDTATWMLGEIAPGGTRNVILKASSPEEGYATTCSAVTFVPSYCETIKVVRADLELVLDLVPAVTVCDPIPARITVRNSGSSRLTNVVVTDALPSGLATADGQTRISLNAGDLNPGESKAFDLDLKASSTGRYEASPVANSAQGISAEDMGSVVVSAPSLMVSCEAPSERFIGRPISVCYQVKNTGNATSSNTVLTVPVPAGATFQGATGGGNLSGNAVVWNLGSIAAEGVTEVCATFTGKQAGMVSFSGSVQGNCAPVASTVCRTEVTGIPAILLEVIDLEDPIEVGSNQTYQIVVTNQGSAPATNVRVTAQLEDEQSYVTSSGTTSARASGQTIVMNAVPSIAPGANATWQVVVKALSEGDIRFSVQLESDQMGRPVRETEATNQY